MAGIPNSSAPVTDDKGVVSKSWFSFFAGLSTTPSFTNIGDYVNDAAAQAGGVQIGGVYRNGSILMVRVI